MPNNGMQRTRTQRSLLSSTVRARRSCASSGAEKVMTPEGSYLKTSRQIWKFNLFFALMMCSGVMMAVAFVGMRGENAWRFVVVMLVGVAVALISSIWACLAIRCPRCKARLLWKAWREQSAQSWFFWFTNLKRCPACGSDSPCA